MCRYDNAKQFKRMRKALKKLKGYVDRIMRGLRRHLKDFLSCPLLDRITAKRAGLATVASAPRGSRKIYALHEPEVDCISQGRARVRCEFGIKVSVAATIDEEFVVGIRALVSNPYNGHTLAEALKQVEILTEQRTEVAVVERS